MLINAAGYVGYNSTVRNRNALPMTDSPGHIYKDAPLEIPAGAVVVAGSRAIKKGRGPELGLSIYTPIIVKYRDEKTDASVRLEDYLR